ncbi:MAG: hypothetical protein ABEJ95_07240 [Candidatus Nanohalobium sp.]
MNRAWYWDGSTNIDLVDGGNVEIPNGNLDMNGNNIQLNGGYLSNDGSNEGITVDNSGNVQVPSGKLGVGTSPSASLHIAGQDNSPVLLIEPDSMTGETSRIRFSDPDGGTGNMNIEYADDGAASLSVTGGGLDVSSPSNSDHTVDVGGSMGVEGNLDMNGNNINSAGSVTVQNSFQLPVGTDAY